MNEAKLHRRHVCLICGLEPRVDLEEENQKLKETIDSLYLELGKYVDIPKIEYLSDENQKLKAQLEVAIKLLEGLPSDQYALAMQKIEELGK